jgi:hypothetical protein
VQKVETPAKDPSTLHSQAHRALEFVEARIAMTATSDSYAEYANGIQERIRDLKEEIAIAEKALIDQTNSAIEYRREYCERMTYGASRLEDRGSREKSRVERWVNMQLITSEIDNLTGDGSQAIDKMRLHYFGLLMRHDRAVRRAKD